MKSLLLLSQLKMRSSSHTVERYVEGIEKNSLVINSLSKIPLVQNSKEISKISLAKFDISFS